MFAYPRAARRRAVIPGKALALAPAVLATFFFLKNDGALIFDEVEPMKIKLKFIGERRGKLQITF